MDTLPENLVIPPAFVGKIPDYVGDWQPARIYIDGKFLFVETPEGTRRIDSTRSLLETVLRVKHTFTITTPGELDTCLRWLGRDNLFKLYYGLSVQHKGWTIRYRGSSITFVRGDERHYLWNLFNFFKLKNDEPPLLLEAIYAFVLLLIDNFERVGVSYSNLASPSAIARHLLLRYAYQEFKSRTMEWEVLNQFYAACHGGRQESTGIGTTDVYNFDMRNAHLTIIEGMQSIRGCQRREDWPYIAESRYGTYLIEADIPRMPLCPLPVEMGGKWTHQIAYPYGNVSGWYAKPFLDLLIELDIPFKVLQSQQFVPAAANQYPYRNIAKLLRKFIRESPPYLSPKSLYWGLAGSTISWRWYVDGDTGEMIPKAFNVFNPIIYSHVLATQTVRVYREAMRSRPVAIRADAVSVRDRIFSTMRPEDSGEMLFVTPLFKSFPSGRGEQWKMLVEANRDQGYFDYPREEYPTIKQMLNMGVPLGRKRNYSIMVRPNHGKRMGIIPNKIGTLLDRWFPSTAPSFESVSGN